MKIQMNFADPGAISSVGSASDRIAITFWSSELLKGANGVSLAEGQTIAKGIVPQTDPVTARQAQALGKWFGIGVALIVGLGCLAAVYFRLDSTPFYMLFTVWQLFMHLPMLNIKMPGVMAEYWREQLHLWTMRSDGIMNIMIKGTSEQVQSQINYALVLDASGLHSTQVFVNLGLVLWVPAFIIFLMPMAYCIDTCITLPSKRFKRWGGRKRLTARPIAEVLTNFLIRYALLWMLDIMICVFVSLRSGHLGVFTSSDYIKNIVVDYLLIFLLAAIWLIFAGHSVYRYWSMQDAQSRFDVRVNRYLLTLCDGTSPGRPENGVVYQLAYMTRQSIYAALIVFLTDYPGL
jgi:hypothetical protein